MNILKSTLEYGTYYYPATKHYNYASPIIYCDNCGKCNLTACIGYDKYDLCLSCVNYLTTSEHLIYHNDSISKDNESLITKNIKPEFYQNVNPLMYRNIRQNGYILGLRPEFNQSNMTFNGNGNGNGNGNMYSLD